MQKHEQAYKAPAYISAELKWLIPPEYMTVSEWTERNRILTARDSNITGKWRNEVTPYLVAIMDEFNNPETQEIIFCKPTQVGYTALIQNVIGYCVAQDPAPVMVVYPDQKTAEKTAEQRIIPMIKNCPVLAELFLERKTKKTNIAFKSINVNLAWAGSDSSTSSTPVCYLLLDEVDKYRTASKREADPLRLARERTKSFPNRKIFMGSTPTLREGNIWRAKEQADIEKHFFVPCPHCGKHIELRFAQVQWQGKEETENIAARADEAIYICQECGSGIEERHRVPMIRKGEWRIVAERNRLRRSVAYWMNTLYSPFTSWREIAREFMQSKSEPELLQNFVNSWLAEPWEESAAKQNEGKIYDARTDLPEGVVPEWANLITAGVDVQRDRLYFAVRAFGEHFRSQLVLHGCMETFPELSDILNRTFCKAGGERMQVSLAAIDSGDQTDLVYDYYLQNMDWCVACKGVSGKPYHFSISTINKDGSASNGLPLLLVNGGRYKDMIFGRMGTTWLVDKDVDADYAQQVTNEKKVIVRRNGQAEEAWKPKFAHAPNHYLDAEVYALAAADKMGARWMHLEPAYGSEEAEEAASSVPTENTAWIDQNASERLKWGN